MGWSGLSGVTASARRAVFGKPGGPVYAALGVFIAIVAVGWCGAAAAWIPEPDIRDFALLGGGVTGMLALSAGFVNAWRQPMLVVEPERLTVPTFLGRRQIPVTTGQLIGELLASPADGGRRSGGIEGNKFVHFFALDESGKPVLLVAVHQAAPLIVDLRRAFHEVAGLRVASVGRAPGARRPLPDLAHWQNG